MIALLLELKDIDSWKGTRGLCEVDMMKHQDPAKHCELK
jgi:hypothetical protein